MRQRERTAAALNELNATTVRKFAELELALNDLRHSLKKADAPVSAKIKLLWEAVEHQNKVWRDCGFRIDASSPACFEQLAFKGDMAWAKLLFDLDNLLTGLQRAELVWASFGRACNNFKK